ncbi:MAG: class I poly(R)-hydroxyalkanoic acid synthase [Sphingomonadales bacterium]|nr:class I poly(R)-hydroxyalkanoic acid synthase [Sphingomonadales bacterium]MBD3772065.1 class I poly(R)-hydroxyalkanoic acid synthase [Paracoccaceae bacterium]MBD3813800.1 class I poly(R)-hydroxyalkanoic acid synthase [Betaproteobacteria bacterium]
MAEKGEKAGEGLTDLLAMQADAARSLYAQFLPDVTSADPAMEDMQHWLGVATQIQSMWFEFQTERALDAQAELPAKLADPGQWADLLADWYSHMPLSSPERQEALWRDSLDLWERVLGHYGIGPEAGEGDAKKPDLPRRDRRFADPKWREEPIFALIHQTYLMLADQLMAMVDEVKGVEPAKREQLRFATRTLIDALSPANFPMTNPLVVERTLSSRGDNLVKGFAHLLADLKRGQLTHTDNEAFELGRNIAVTPGKVIHQTRLYQLIQYSPTTDEVQETPLVIFPPWINRFYILDLNPKKSFIRWAVEQGLTVFVVSWKSADASFADVTWDDYIAAQIEAIDLVRERLDVKAVHTIGYCVAGTTLAATLAVLARRGDAKKVKSATFFTAQVDFEKAGELLNFIDDGQLAMIEQLGTDGYLDGRYLSATFNLLRGPDLIWNYVVNNYLLGEDYPAFDLLHWNGDFTNLPSAWHQAYLKDLYRDNRLVEPDSLNALNTPIDLSRIETPCYVQAGREDHIAPPDSVWRIMHHLKGPARFLLAGSGHIAGVVNPPEAHKYQYWTNEDGARSLEEFVAGATEHPGSWWPDWIDWIRSVHDKTVPAKGKRKPGTKGDTVLEDAPGSYVKSR